jgi:hypothetical protein
LVYRGPNGRHWEGVVPIGDERTPVGTFSLYFQYYIELLIYV